MREDDGPRYEWDSVIEVISSYLSQNNRDTVLRLSPPPPHSLRSDSKATAPLDHSSCPTESTIPPIPYICSWHDA
jgi:hypothetical protein